MSLLEPLFHGIHIFLDFHDVHEDTFETNLVNIAFVTGKQWYCNLEIGEYMKFITKGKLFYKLNTCSGI